MTYGKMVCSREWYKKPEKNYIIFLNKIFANLNAGHGPLYIRYYTIITYSGNEMKT
jgi:hypothetical protein